MPQESDAVSGPLVVLLVDDEPQIRKLLRSCLLQQQVYRVFTASSGEEALDVSRQCDQKIDILITDIEMAKINGLALYQHIRGERPETAVLFISGTADGQSLPGFPLLAKPFRLQDFVVAVAEVLSTHSGAATRKGRVSAAALRTSNHPMSAYRSTHSVSI